MSQHHDNLSFEIHRFADASTCAHVAVIYLRVISSSSSVHVSLLVAKTKVAPLKTVGILRLELNALILLSRLIKWDLSASNLIPSQIFGWTDSSIVLV